MKTIYCTLPILYVIFLGGCGSVERIPTRMEETAIISCEAAHVTILAMPSVSLDGDSDSTAEPGGDGRL